jgi:site-specific recombinase XerD
MNSRLLQTRAQRKKLPISCKPVFVKIGVGLGLGYRHNGTRSGSWVLRVADGKGGYSTKPLAAADDHEPADGKTVLNYWQACEAARIAGAAALAKKTIARPVTAAARTAPLSVAEALDAYETHLRARRGDLNNARRARLHLTAELGQRPVAQLTVAELADWRETLAAKLMPAPVTKIRRHLQQLHPGRKVRLTPAATAQWREKLAEPLKAATINRLLAAIKAALNLAADRDERITNRRAWQIGLRDDEGVEEARNVILKEEEVRRLVAEAPTISPEFALFVEVAAETGARVVSQIARLIVKDLQRGATPRLMMPSSRKGRGVKPTQRRPSPIPEDLAERLWVAAAGRPETAPLLVKPSGARWSKSDHFRLFQRLARRCGEDPETVTIYALRHSSIVRQLLGGVATRVVAVNHDTSVVMLERNYSPYITDHSDAMTRSTLLNLARPTADNVVPIGSRK